MDYHEDHPRNNHVRSIISPRIQEDYIKQVSDKSEGKMTNKLFQDKESHFGRPVQTRRISSEPTIPGSLPTLSGDIPKIKHKEPRNEWRSFSECSSS